MIFHIFIFHCCFQLAHRRTASPRGSVGAAVVGPRPPQPKAMPQDGMWVQTWIWMPATPGAQPLQPPPGLPAVPAAPKALATSSKAAAKAVARHPDDTAEEESEFSEVEEDCSSKAFVFWYFCLFKFHYNNCQLILHMLMIILRRNLWNLQQLQLLKRRDMMTKRRMARRMSRRRMMTGAPWS